MLNVIRDNPGARKKFKALGRGIGSGKGKTCGRGGKGQTARSGVAIKGFEGGQMPLIRRLPKRGFNSINKVVYETVNIGTIEALIEKKKLTKKITIQNLRDNGLLQGINKQVKLLGTGDLKSKFEIEIHAISKSAESKLAENGSKFTLVEVKRAKNPEKKEKIAATESKEKKTKETKSTK